MAASEKSSTEKPQKKWNRLGEHYFRALGQVDPQRAALNGVGNGAEGEGEPAAVPWQQRKHVLRYHAYDLALRVLYFGLSRFNGLRARKRKAPQAGRRLRVLRITSLVAQGGVAKVVVQTVLQMPAAEVETHLLVFGKKFKNPPVLERQTEIELVNRRLELSPGDYKSELFKHVFKLSRAIVKCRPDVIHLHEPQFAPGVLMAAGLAGGYPVAVHLHSLYQGRRLGVSPLQMRIERDSLRHVALIACSQTIKLGAEKWLRRLERPIGLIEDGADDVAIWPGEPGLARALAQAAAGRTIIAKMARLTPLKRIEDYLTACRILLDEGYPIFVCLMSYGKDKHERQMREQFETWFAPEEGEFLFHVKVPQELIKHVGIGVSTSSLEGLGLNVLEYQVEGVPVVCTDLPAHREMVTHGVNGMLFPTADVPALVRILKQMLGDEALRRRLGEAGRQSAAARKWSETGRQTVEFYRSMLEKKA